MKILIEMRPAFDGHAGIPQETRLLFKGLASTPGVQVLGLLQSSNLVAEPGLPLDAQGLICQGIEKGQEADRLSQVVVSLQQGAASHRLEHLRKKLLRWTGPPAAALGAVFGRHTPLTGFLGASYKDWLWRGLFAKTLAPSDADLVTRQEFRVLRWPWSMANAVGVGTGALGRALYPRLDTRGIDVMIAETPYPGRVRQGTRLVVRYHDAIPLLMPHTIKDRGYHRTMHYLTLRRNAADGAWFVCVSESTRQDLLTVLPQVAERSLTIPNMIADEYFLEDSPAARVAEVIWSRKQRQAPHGGGLDVRSDESVDGKLPYLLMVSTVEPRKNHQALIEAWELLRSGGYPGLNLVCVGGLGWDHQGILQRLTPWLGRGGVHLLQDVPSADLRLLYRHAAVTVCPSFGEGFDFSGVEAMASGGVVAASDLRVHREVFGDASEYFDPYAPVQMAAVLAGLLAPQAATRREHLRANGARVSALYRPACVLPQWQSFLQRLVSSAHSGT